MKRPTEVLSHLRDISYIVTRQNQLLQGAAILQHFLGEVGEPEVRAVPEVHGTGLDGFTLAARPETSEQAHVAYLGDKLFRGWFNLALSINISVLKTVNTLLVAD